MCLLEMNVGETASIDNVNVNGALKSRLNSLGLIRNANICVKQFGFFKSTVQIMVNKSFIAIRKHEAELIQVHKI